jgi:hypothetical protein
MHLPDGTKNYRHPAGYFGADRVSLDGTLAPRKLHARYDGGLRWVGEGKTRKERLDIEYSTGECPQGQFLLHVLDNGYTAIQWWDRCQGDQRYGCSSTVLLEGAHTAEEMLAALREHFPHVLANLDRAGIKLVEVSKSPSPNDGGGE